MEIGWDKGYEKGWYWWDRSGVLQYDKGKVRSTFVKMIFLYNK